MRSVLLAGLRPSFENGSTSLVSSFFNFDTSFWVFDTISFPPDWYGKISGFTEMTGFRDEETPGAEDSRSEGRWFYAAYSTYG